jgi:glycosyltransferase involved in cell wall biosynthesis
VENPSDDRRVRNARQARLLFDSFVNQHGLNEAIRFHGVVTGDKKQGLLQSAHFLVLPTNYDAEGQPISIIEAMAYGCVVIATAYRAIPDMVDPGVTGWLVPFESPHRIAEGVLACIENPDTFQSMSDAAITLVRRRFTQETHVERLLAILLQDANASGRSSTFAGNTTSSGDLAGHTAKAPLQHAD